MRAQISRLKIVKTKQVVIIDSNFIEGSINSKLISALIENTVAYDFSNPLEAKSFLEKYRICPDLVIMSEHHRHNYEQVLQWMSEAQLDCRLTLIRAENEVIGDPRTISRNNFIHEIELMLYN